jgi:predicted PurR-regulated permease PerM
MPNQRYLTLLVSLASLAVIFAAMRIAEGLLAPMLAAVVLGVVCAPFTDRVERLGVPRVFAALLVLISFVSLLLLLFLVIEPTVSDAIRNGPLIWRELTDLIEDVRGALAGVQELQETVTEALGDGKQDGSADEEVAVPGVMDALAYAPSIAAAIMIFIGTLYFFLVARSDIYDRIDQMDLRLSKLMLCRAEARVSRYFLTITLINAMFGALVGLVMAAIGLPNAILWGLAAFLVNFVLYLGPAFFAVALGIAGLIEFDGAASLLPMAIYLAMNMTEGQFVTPSLVGRHMQVNPLLVFVSLVFWLWLWGPIGGVVAIPLLVWLLHVLEQVEAPPPQVVVSAT